MKDADASAKHRRRSLRLKGYDYAQAGAYFITMCTQDRACLFGKVVDGTMCLNDAGQLVAILWSDMPVHFPGIDSDVFVVMPNHLHGIIVLSDNTAVVGAPLVGAQDNAGRPQERREQPESVARTDCASLERASEDHASHHAAATPDCAPQAPQRRHGGALPQ
jgi:putative transposase